VAIRVPRLSYEDLREIANRFLVEHGASDAVPVPIEEIVEFALGINIVPLPGLHAEHDIDGFLSADMTEISVDLSVFESRPARYRFTLAHEVGHIVLHGDALKAAAPASILDWKQFVRELPEPDRGWLEWQAYAFAGLVLAPRQTLAIAHRGAVQSADEAGFDLRINLEVAREYMASSIGRLFEVSGAVITKRLVSDGIWER
jgi:uncharacterized protein DUF955